MPLSALCRTLVFSGGPLLSVTPFCSFKFMRNVRSREAPEFYWPLSCLGLVSLSLAEIGCSVSTQVALVLRGLAPRPMLLILAGSLARKLDFTFIIGYTLAFL